MMKNLNAFLLTAALFLSVSVLAGCENGDKTEETPETGSELTQTQKELEQIKKDSTELDKYVTNLKEQINDLKIENQRLIAQTKRLEAEIIDLKLDLGQSTRLGFSRYAGQGLGARRQLEEYRHRTAGIPAGDPSRRE